jgi:hypothetical protein
LVLVCLPPGKARLRRPISRHLEWFGRRILNQVVVRDASRLLLVWLAALASAAVVLTVMYFVLLILIGLLFFRNGIGPDD